MPTAAQYRSYLQLPQVQAALATIAWAEGGKSYSTLFGGGSFTGSQHPNLAITAGGYTSTAAGRYQFLYRTWIEIKNRLGLEDFGPFNQDIAALDLISQRGQVGRLLAGDFEGMMRGLGCAWAALPYATCGQNTRPLAQTMNYFNSAVSALGGFVPAPAGADLDTFAGVSSVMLALGLLAAVLILRD